MHRLGEGNPPNNLAGLSLDLDIVASQEFPILHICRGDVASIGKGTRNGSFRVSEFNPLWIDQELALPQMEKEPGHGFHLTSERSGRSSCLM